MCRNIVVLLHYFFSYIYGIFTGILVCILLHLIDNYEMLSLSLRLLLSISSVENFCGLSDMCCDVMLSELFMMISRVVIFGKNSFKLHYFQERVWRLVSKSYTIYLRWVSCMVRCLPSLIVFEYCLYIWVLLLLKSVTNLKLYWK